jgi:hypothetical protein
LSGLSSAIMSPYSLRVSVISSSHAIIREHEIADVTKKPEFTPFYQKFSLFVFVSEKNIAFLFSLLFVE